MLTSFDSGLRFIGGTVLNSPKADASSGILTQAWVNGRAPWRFGLYLRLATRRLVGLETGAAHRRGFRSFRGDRRWALADLEWCSVMLQHSMAVRVIHPRRRMLVDERGTGGNSFVPKCQSALPFDAPQDLGSQATIYTRPYSVNSPDFNEAPELISTGYPEWLAGHTTVLPGMAIGQGAVDARPEGFDDIPPLTVLTCIRAKPIRQRNLDVHDRLRYAKRFAGRQNKGRGPK